jgi:hypothetical protein
MDPNIRYFLKVQLALIAMSVAIGIALSIMLRFPINLLAIFGVFIGISYYQRRQMLKRLGTYGGQVRFMSSEPDGFSGGVNFYCMNCGIKHKDASCPKCGSKLKRAGY